VALGTDPRANRLLPTRFTPIVAPPTDLCQFMKELWRWRARPDRATPH
jgi:hypothetical protein